jgi:4-amino-4-deoxy-L-arabinose transferase-like glycosyltransferase
MALSPRFSSRSRFLANRRDAAFVDAVACGILFMVALGLRLYFLSTIDLPESFYKYPFFADKLLAGADIGPRLLDLSPLYLWFMTFMKSLGPEFAWTNTKLVQGYVGAANCVLLYLVGSRMAGRLPALVGALLMAGYANLIALETTYEPLVFAIFFNLACMGALLLAGAGQEDRVGPLAWVMAGLAGLLAGLSVLTKPNFLLFVPLGALWLALAAHRHARLARRVGVAALFCLAAAAAVAPVTARNYARFNDFVLVTADYGKVFFHGNAPKATGFLAHDLPEQQRCEKRLREPDCDHAVFREVAEERVGRELKPSEAARYWFTRTLQSIRARPLRWLGLELKKLALFFHHYEIHLIAFPYRELNTALQHPFVRYGCIAPLALLGMALAWPRRRRHALAYAGVAVYLVSCLIFVTNSRYRSPAVPWLCLFAGTGVVGALGLLVRRRVAAFLAAAALLAAFTAFVHLPYPEETAQVDQYKNRAFLRDQLRKPFDIPQ